MSQTESFSLKQLIGTCDALSPLAPLNSQFHSTQCFPLHYVASFIPLFLLVTQPHRVCVSYVIFPFRYYILPLDIVIIFMLFYYGKKKKKNTEIQSLNKILSVQYILTQVQCCTADL